MAAKWKIYYSDGATFSSAEGGPEVAPTQRVQVIVLIDHNHGWRTQASSDFYVWDDRSHGAMWWGVDIFGLSDYFDKPGWKRVLKGETIHSDQFSEVMALAMADPDFPQKTSFNNQERKVK